MKTAAIYAHVSSDRQKEEQTIASQTSALRAYAAAHEYLVADGYVCEDEGWSGAILVRPGLERFRDVAAQGHLEVLLVYSPDRLSRKYAYQDVVARRVRPPWGGGGVPPEPPGRNP
jgi:site-specific DNA recombinase